MWRACSCEVTSESIYCCWARRSRAGARGPGRWPSTPPPGPRTRAVLPRLAACRARLLTVDARPGHDAVAGAEAVHRVFLDIDEEPGLPAVLGAATVTIGV